MILSCNKYLKILFLATAVLSVLSAVGQSAKSNAYYAQGVKWYNQGKYHEAISCFEKAAIIDDAEIPKESNRREYSHIWEASCYYKLGDTIKARTISPMAYEFDPVDRRLTVQSDQEGDLSYQAQQSGDLSHAILHARRCLELEEESLGRTSLHCIGSCLIIADLYNATEDVSRALTFYNDGLSRLSEINKENSRYNFLLLAGRARANLGKGETKAARNDAERAKRIALHEKATFHDEYLLALTDLLTAQIACEDQQYSTATNLTVSAFNTLIDLYTPSSEDLFYSITDCISMLAALGQEQIAVPLIKRVLATVEHRDGSNIHKGILLTLLGEYYEQTDTDQAIEYCKEGASLLDNDHNSDDYQSNQCTLAYLYVLKKEYDSAIKIYETICRHYQETGNSHAAYRRALTALGDIYLETGAIDESASCYKKLLSLLSDNKHSLDYIFTFIKWISVLARQSMQGGNNTAESYHYGYEAGKELREIFASLHLHDFINQGIGVPQLAAVLLPFYQTILADIASTGNVVWLNNIDKQLTRLTYDYLIPVCSRYNRLTCQSLSLLAYIKYLLGDNQTAIAEMEEVIEISQKMGWEYDHYIHDLAYYQYDSGDTAHAYVNFETGFKFEKEQILSNYRWMTHDERDRFTDFHRGNLDNIPHYAAITPRDQRYAALGYNALLFAKGLLLNSTIELTRLLQEEGDTETLAMLNRWQNICQRICDASPANDEDLSQWKTEAKTLEKQLLARSKTYGDYTQALSVQYQDVQKALGDNDIAIEFFSYLQNARTRIYGALLLNKKGMPKYVEIGSDSEWRHICPDKDSYRNPELFNTILGRLKPYMPQKEKGSIYFSADGMLHMIPIENLSGAESYNLKRLSSTRELACSQGKETRASCMAIFGGISYGIDEIASYYPLKEKRSRESGIFLEELPGTKVEAQQIDSLLSPRIPVEMLLAESASEEALRKISGRRISLLHIAGHGFFENSEYTTTKSDPLLLSGLYLAGAQNTLWGIHAGNPDNNGIITAYEIANLDLRGLKLAVLSACETGRGIISPDGVFGLQRGFKQAGAESMMMSLWKVDDQATQLLMCEFYKEIVQGANPYEALKNAQRVVRRQYPDPYYWAGFILIDADKRIII